MFSCVRVESSAMLVLRFWGCPFLFQDIQAVGLHGYFGCLLAGIKNHRIKQLSRLLVLSRSFKFIIFPLVFS